MKILSTYSTFRHSKDAVLAAYKYTQQDHVPDEVMRNGLCCVLTVIERHQEKNKRGYVVSRPLAEALLGVESIELGELKLSEASYEYYMLPKNLLFDQQGDMYREAYFALLPPNTYGELITNPSPHFTLICFVRGEGGAVAFNVTIEAGDTLDSLVERISSGVMYSTLMAGTDIVTKVLRFFINASVYIKTPHPDIEALAPHALKKNFAHEYIAPNKIKTSDFLSLGFNFHRHFKVDSAEVRGHFRWQRCGTQFSEVRLIFIKPHERHYKTPTHQS